MIRIAISGFGRIGRNFLRTMQQDPQALKCIEVVAINIGPARLDYTAHMFKYDSLMGTYHGNVAVQGDELIIDDHRIKIIAESDPAQLPWKSLGIDWVVECSGRFTDRAGASKHLSAGAGYVLISAPAKDEDISIIPGINDAAFDATKHKIVSLGSCTTNAFLPTLKVLNDSFTLERGFMTTVHSYTNSQVLLDVEDKDLRRSRAAAINIIPTSTGASKMVAKIIPELAGLIEAKALRVPVAKVSIIDLTFITQLPLTIQAINQAFIEASQGPMKGIMRVTDIPLVSSDFSMDPHSVIIDSLLTATCGTTMGKVFGWYDNEWGYSQRLKDFLTAQS